MTPPSSRNIRPIEFHRTKYGRELLIDVIRAADIQTFEVNGAPHVDPAYFARFFKRETGMSPTTFRKQGAR